MYSRIFRSKVEQINNKGDKKMAINDVLAEVVEKLGLKDSEIDTLSKSRATLDASIRNNQDQLEAMNDDIDAIEAQIRLKKKTYNETTSTAKQKIVKRELMTLLSTHKRKSEIIDVIADRIDNDRALYDKLEIVIFALKNPARTDAIETATSDYDIIMEEWEKENSAMKDLQDKQYQSTSDENISLETVEKQLEKKKDEQFEKELAEF